jgi:hypothetical protein
MMLPLRRWMTSDWKYPGDDTQLLLRFLRRTKYEIERRRLQRLQRGQMLNTVYRTTRQPSNMTKGLVYVGDRGL